MVKRRYKLPPPTNYSARHPAQVERCSFGTESLKAGSVAADDSRPCRVALVGRLAAIGLVTYVLWRGSAAAIGMLVPGEPTAFELVPAALIASAPLTWYLWVTVLEPIRLRRS